MVTLDTVNDTDFFVFMLRLGARKMHVPFPPRSPVVQVSDASDPAPVQVPTTVAPFNGLWLASWTVTSMVALHVDPLTAVIPSRSPT